ncbi:hypothetical protein CEP53_014317 [Fusarium sp. AF-6]|nr:hypothetical protein CEP53_014317 [Fusarium sp. AF-6]
MSVLAERVTLFPTAGGAYHFSGFLCPEKYRRYVDYPIGRLNYLGWVFTVAACAAIQTGLTFSLVIMCDPTSVAWVINLFFLKSLHVAENLGCIISMMGLVDFTITLLARAPKADASFVFNTTMNQTECTLSIHNGRSYRSVQLHGGLVIPKTLYITVVTRLTVDVVWILTVGSCVTDMNAVIYHRVSITFASDIVASVPIIDFIRLALKTDAAAITFNCEYNAANVGRPFLRKRDTSLLLSSGFNAILGTEAVFMLLIHGKSYQRSFYRAPFGLGRLGYPIRAISVLYTLAVVVLVMFPGVYPITFSDFNYTILLTAICAILCVAISLIDGRTCSKPPSFVNFVGTVVTNTTEFMDRGKQDSIPEEPGKVAALGS